MTIREVLRSERAIEDKEAVLALLLSGRELNKRDYSEDFLRKAIYQLKQMGHDIKRRRVHHEGERTWEVFYYL